MYQKANKIVKSGKKGGQSLSVPVRSFFYALQGTLFAVFLLLIAPLDEAVSQPIPLDQAMGVHHSVLPVFGYRSDDGLIGGGMYRRLDYGRPDQQFANQLSVQFTASTRATISGQFEFEQTETFGTSLRSRYYLEVLRHPAQTYFGIGNQTEFDRDRFNDGFYYYLNRSITFDYEGRWPMVEIGERGNLDAQFILSVSNFGPRADDDDTLFAGDNVPGGEGGWVNRLGAGLVLDQRDSEFDPRSGYRLEAGYSAAGSWTASDYSFGSWMGEARGYLSPFSWLVIAQKLRWEQVTGEPSFRDMPSIGHKMGLRGYALHRFRGERAIWHILEMRSWLFSVLDDQIRLGGHLFMDTGRVFMDGESFSDLPSGLHQTFGIGGAMSILNPDFVFRAELGFSDELYRIYVGVGYLF